MGRTPGSGRLNCFFDECVSPIAADHFRNGGEHGIIHPRDNGASGQSDPDVLEYCIANSLILVTVNGKDFRKLCGSPDVIHPGLVVIPSLSRARQIQVLEDVFACIDGQAQCAGEDANIWMTNKAVEATIDGTISICDLPSS